MTQVRSEIPPEKRPEADDVGAELAVCAWERLCRRVGRASAVTPTAVVRLKRQRRAWHKSAVYRLEGAGHERVTVVAKRCLRSTGRVERDVYEKLLPHIGVPRVPYYGYVEEEEGAFAWLFMGDAGSIRPTMADRAVVGEWLARVHAGAALAPAEVAVALPDRGPAYFRGLLPSARAGLDTARQVAAGAGHDYRPLATMARALDEVESRWHRVTAACEAWPRTLVHADFSRKNVRLRRDATGVHVVTLDWETAGWGPPAADLADVPWGRSRDRVPADLPEAAEDSVPWYGPVSLDVYAAAISRVWPGVRRGDVERLARVGSLFRIIDATCWASRQVEFGGVDKGMGRLRAYGDDLVPALAALDA